MFHGLMNNPVYQ